MISKYKNKFPFNIYDKMFEDNTGTSLNEDEIDYLLNFADQNIYINSSRELYTFCLFLLKRWYPLFVIKILILSPLHNHLILILQFLGCNFLIIFLIFI